MNRLSLAAACVLSLGVSGVSAQFNPRPQKPAYDDGQVEVVPVQGNVYLVAGSGANIAVQSTPDGLLLVDASICLVASLVSPRVSTKGASFKAISRVHLSAATPARFKVYSRTASAER